MDHLVLCQGKQKIPGGKCVTYCGLPFFNIAEVAITGPKWQEIKTALICKHSLYRANAEEEMENACLCFGRSSLDEATNTIERALLKITVLWPGLWVVT
jgi:hypothetical protein